MAWLSEETEEDVPDPGPPGVERSSLLLKELEAIARVHPPRPTSSLAVLLPKLRDLVAVAEDTTRSPQVRASAARKALETLGPLRDALGPELAMTKLRKDLSGSLDA